MVDYVKKFKKGLFAMLGLAVLIGGIIFYQVSGARAATVDVLNGSGNMNSLWTWVQILLATGTSDGATAGSPSGPPSALAQGTGRGKVVQGYFKTGFKTPQGVSLDAASLSLYFKKAITNAPTKFDISWEIRDASDTTLILSGIINSALGNVAWTNYTNNSIDTTQLAVNTNYTLRLYMDGTTANINGSAVQVNWDDVVLNVTYTPDTTPPVTTMTSPTDGSRVKGSVPLQASASDNMGVASSWVYFEYATNTSFTGKTILPATYSGGNVTKSWDTSALNGTYYVRSHVYDTSNLDTYSNYFTYIVDNAGPTVVSATATDKTHVDVKFSEDMDSTSVQTSTNYSITGNGGLSVSSAVIDGTDKSLVHLTTSTQSNGTYTVTVSNVTDLVGNTLGAPASATFDGVTGPTFTVEYYSDSALTTALPVLASKPITKAQTVYLKITANKALTGAPTFNLDAPGAGNDLTGATTTLVSGFSYKGTWVVNAGQGDGDAIITVSANSTDGGSSTNVTPTSGGTATVDCTITSPTLATVNGYDKITLNWSTADSDISTFWVYRSTSDAFTPSVSNLVYTANSGAILSVVDNVAPGTYYYVIKARDTAGNISALSNYASGISMVGPPSFSVQYYSDAALTVPLNVYLSKPITKAQTVYLKITASKAMSVGPIFKLDAPSTDNDVTDVTTVLVSGNTYKGIWNVAFSGIAYDGDAAVQVKGTSADGGVAVYGAPTSGGTVTVDTKISTFNSFTISALVNDASLNWSIPEGDIDKYLIYRSKTEGFVPDGSNLIYTEENGAATTYTNTNVPDGTYYYKIIAQDFAGNAITSTEVSIGLPADLTGPSIVKAEATSKQLIYLTFNEKIQDPNTTGGTITVGGLTVQGCFLTADPRVVRVVLTTPQGTGNKYATPNKYTVTVQNIKDLIGNNTALGTQDFDAFTPHGKYAPYPVAPGNGNRICGLCHKTHNATGLKLLNATSIKKFCFVCHGNTGNSVYLVEKEFTSWVSGGVYSTSLHKSLDAADGGNNVLSCVDCHDPHGARRPGTNDLWPKLLVATNVYGVVYNGGNGYCLVCHGQFGNNLTFSTGYGMSAYWISLAGDHLINPQGFSGMEVQSSVYNAMHYDAREQLLNPASGSAITCVTCHEKHGSENSGLTDETPANSNRPASNNAREKLCFKCHNTTNIGNGKLTPLTAGYDVYARFNTGGYTKHQITNEASYGFTCSSCHGPHSVSGRTFDNSSSSLPSDISDPTNTKNNFNKSMGTMNDFCLKCHNAASGQVLQKITSATALVPYSVYLPVGSTFGYGSGWNKSSYSSSQHNASSVVCTGCHDPHGSAYKGMTAYPEDPSGAPTSTSGACLRCHGGGATPAGPNVYTGGFGAASGGHPTLTRSGLHSNTTESNNANWNQGAGRHSECSDCHDPHRAQGGISTPGANRATVADWSAFGANGGPDSETRVDDVLPSSLTGQWGVNVGLGTFTRGSGTPGTNSFSYNASPTRQYNICFKCHSSYSWNGSGTSTTYTSTPTGTPPATTFPLTTYISAGNAGAGKQPDIAEQFNPGNYAFHPLFRIGLNQPVANLNTNWSTSAGRRFATSTYRGGDGITSIFGVVYNIGNYTVTGLDNTFVEGWGTKSLVTCSDCHASSDTTVDGPHGSAQKYLLRKAEPRTVKIADGTVVNLNTGTQLAAAYAGDTRAVNNFCLNCHRADVYGNGRGDYNGITTSYVTFSRLSHNFRTSSSPSGNCMASGNAAIGTVDQSPSCLGCHGGREPGGIHGTKLVSSGNPGTDPQGKRFANGANWGGHELGTTSMGCYTVGDDAVAACGHGHTGTGTGTNYTY